MTKSNIAPSIVAHGEAFGLADNKAAKEYDKVFRGMKADKIVKADIEKGGQYLADFQNGLLIGWQGADFAKAYAEAKGKDRIKGKKLGSRGAWVNETKSKVEWQRQLSSKVAKARNMYGEFLGEAGTRASERAAPTGLIAKIAKDCAAWQERLEMVQAGNPKPSDKGIEADVSGLITPLANIIKLAKSLDK